MAAIAAMNGRAWSHRPIRLDLDIHAPSLEVGRAVTDYLGGVMDSLDGSHGPSFTYLPVVYEDDCQVWKSAARFVEAASPRYVVRIEFCAADIGTASRPASDLTLRPAGEVTAEELTEEPLPTRNQPAEFARRTLVNFECLQAARASGAVVHPVTQLANSLLGLIVFPVEHGELGSIENLKLEELRNAGWQLWDIQQDDPPPKKKPPTEYKTTTLGHLLRHLRNGVAHRRLHFSSDGPDLADVVFHAEDALPDGSPVYWRASLTGPHLLQFCSRLGAQVRK